MTLRGQLDADLPQAAREPAAANPLDDARFDAVASHARELVRRLEGSSVQRIVVEAGDCRVEIQRADPAPGPVERSWAGAPAAHPIAPGAGPGLGVAPGARGASGAFAVIGDPDPRVPVLAPLVGTFYRSPRQGAKAFVDEGDVIEIGQTVCIVEAMKMMNEVGAGEGGRVVEIVASDGEAVEFEQILMYVEPVGD